MRTLSEPQLALTRPSQCPSYIEFGTALNSTRTHPFRVLIASLSRLDRRARSCQSTTLALADCNFASCAFGLSARHICQTTVEHPQNCKDRLVGRGRNTVPQSILRRSTCSANGRPFHKQLGHTGITTARIPGFEYNLLRLETRARRGRCTPSTYSSARTTYRYIPWYILRSRPPARDLTSIWTKVTLRPRQNPE